MSDPHVLTRCFDAHVRDAPERAFVVAGDRTFTRRQVDQQARALAAALAELGIEHGDRVAVNLPQALEWIVTLLACARLGAVVVPVSPQLNVHELRYQLRHAETAAVVTIERYDGVDYLERFEGLLADLPTLQYVVTVGTEELWYDDRIFQFEDLRSSGEGRPVPDVVLSADDDVAVLYTSGMAGKPKGVRLSHAAVIGNAAAVGDVLRLSADDRVLTAVPPFTAFGFGTLVEALVAGAPLVLAPSHDPEAQLDAIATHRVTVVHAAPTGWQLLVRADGFDPARVTSLRTGVIAGGAVSEALVASVRPWCDVLVAYGLTETGPTVTITRFDDTDDRRVATVGRSLADVDVMAVDLVTGTLHGPEAVGEIAVRGPFLMRGYLRMPAETAKVHTPDGFFLTGDLGIIDEDGYVRIIGRRQETILRGGYEVYPREVEDRLRAHPAIDDVCVIGIPHDVLGEQICACLVPVEGAVVTGREILQFARDVLAESKVPDLVRFFDALPLTGGGKVRRRELARSIALAQTASYT